MVEATKIRIHNQLYRLQWWMAKGIIFRTCPIRGCHIGVCTSVGLEISGSMATCA